MHIDRRHRRWLTGWLVVVLLLTQFATAAYACPQVASTLADSAMAEMPGCDGDMSGPTDPAQPQLCKAHCEQGTQTVHPTVANDAPFSPVLLAVLDWAPVALLEMGVDWRSIQAPSGAPPPGSPPLYLSLLVLRN